MRRRRLLTAITFATLTATCAVSSSDDTTTRKEIETATKKFVEAFNAGDVKAMASMWTLDGDFVGENGETIHFQKHLTNRGKKPDGVKDADLVRPALLMTIDRVRLVTPEVATVDGASAFKHFPGAPAVHNRYTATWVLDEKKKSWLLDSVRENHIESGAHHLHLMELDWLIGDWAEAGENSRIESSLRWSPDGNYLERTFSSKLPGRGDQHGTQRIGWDPKRQQFRSWTFGADGGFSQGLWQPTDNGYAIEVSGVTDDGKSTGSLTTITRVDDNTLEWTSTEATEDGEALPDLKLKLVRKSAK